MSRTGVSVESGLRGQKDAPPEINLFVASENRSALITQFQLFAAAGSDRFLGNIQSGVTGLRPHE
jgi:hypothetical protein